MTDVIDKVLQNLFAARRVRNLGMKLQRVQLSLRIFDCGKLGILRARGSAETGGQGGDFIAVAVPDIKLIADSVEQ